MELLNLELNYHCYDGNDITMLKGVAQYVVNNTEKEIVFSVNDTKVIKSILGNLDDRLFYLEQDVFLPSKGVFNHNNIISVNTYLRHCEACYLDFDAKKHYESVNDISTYVYGVDFVNALREVLPEKEEDIL